MRRFSERHPQISVELPPTCTLISLQSLKKITSQLLFSGPSVIISEQNVKRLKVDINVTCNIKEVTFRNLVFVNSGLLDVDSDPLDLSNMFWCFYIYFLAFLKQRSQQRLLVYIDRATESVLSTQHVEHVWLSFLLAYTARSVSNSRKRIQDKDSTLIQISRYKFNVKVTSICS